jgi:hypothetical protein
MGHRRKRLPTPSTDDENDDPNESPPTAPRPTKRSKRDVSLGGVRGEISAMREVFAESVKAQEKYQREIADHLKASNEAYLASQRMFAQILENKL